MACSENALPFVLPPDFAMALAPDLRPMDLASQPDLTRCHGQLLTAKNPGPVLPYRSDGGLAVADLDGDGNADLLTSAATGVSTDALVAWGNGDGTFAPAVTVSTVTPSSGWDVAAVDLNQDGRLDILYGANGAVVVALATGPRQFGRAVWYRRTGVNVISVTVGDVNEDGHIDVLAATGPRTVDWYAGRGDGTLSLGAPAIVNLEAYVFGVVDLDEDGHLDVIGSVYPVAGVTVNLGDGKGGFARQVLIPDPAIEGRMWSSMAADVNGDRHLDVIYGATISPWLGVAFGHGDGTFDAPVHYDVGGAVLGLAAVDLDGRRGVDLLAANFHQGRTSVLLNHGDGTFDAPVEFDTPPLDGPTILGLADFDHDGQMDVAVANFGSKDLHIFLGCP